jgi:mono/diheme cytochrome c family protein
MNSTILLVPIFLSLSLLACSQSADSPEGFSLPKGDIGKGKAVFKKYQCLACHSLEGYEDNAVPIKLENPIVLGGTSYKVKTYAQLVTAIINPSHKIVTQTQALSDVTNEDGSSKMQRYNDIMTVTELTDLVAYLQPKYHFQPPQYRQYKQHGHY